MGPILDLKNDKGNNKYPKRWKLNHISAFQLRHLTFTAKVFSLCLSKNKGHQDKGKNTLKVHFWRQNLCIIDVLLIHFFTMADLALNESFIPYLARVNILSSIDTKETQLRNWLVRKNRVYLYSLVGIITVLVWKRLL